MQCGMEAEPGAICNVNRDSESGDWRFTVIGGVAAKGFCGSGLVDLIACLRHAPRGESLDIERSPKAIRVIDL